MFQGLTDRFEDIFARLRKRGALSETDIDAAMREIRIALLEADVALPVVKDLVEKVRADAVGAEVLRSVTPGQMVVKIVHDRLAAMLGAEATDISLNAVPPVPIMMVGLQGSGKTTTSAKLAMRLRDRHNKKVLMASLDVRRPAAQEQLAVLGRQAGIDTLPILPMQPPRMIAERALDAARKGGYDVVVLDTAGRLAIDETMMQEAAQVGAIAKPVETLLVADAMTGQDAVNTARAFHDRLKLTGIILTRIDGDARGGAALSMRSVTGCPIKFLGTGEKLDALEPFHPGRIASRILGMGDVVSLVEKAQETVEQDEAERLAAKMQKGQFDLDDFASQLRQMRKMGGMSGILGMLPGIAKVKNQLAAANVDDRVLSRQEAMISSMTPAERRRPEIIKASRKIRIAAGSGTSVPEINRLLKQFQEVQRMMKQVSKLGQKGFMRNLMPGMMPPNYPR